MPENGDQGREERFNLASGRIEGQRATPQGGLIVRGNLTRSGVFRYVQPDGSVRRELRHPDEVFNPDSLASLAHATVTVGHPNAVTPENYRKVNIGHVAEVPKRDGKFVAADDIRIQDGEAIEQAKREELQEFSCGYSCRLDKTPGEYEGEPYDAIQRDIRYNHVAAGPPGFGRAGPEVRMRLDSGCSVSGADESQSYVRASMADENKLQEAQAALTKATADLEQARKDAKDAKTDADRADAKSREIAADNQRLRAENEVLKLQASRVDSAKADRERQDKIDAEIADTVAACRLAERVLGPEWKQDGKKAIEIKREVLAHLEPDLGKGPSVEPRSDGAGLDAMLAHREVGRRRARVPRAARSGVDHDGVPRGRSRGPHRGAPQRRHCAGRRRVRGDLGLAVAAGHGRALPHRDFGRGGLDSRSPDERGAAYPRDGCRPPGALLRRGGCGGRVHQPGDRRILQRPDERLDSYAGAPRRASARVRRDGDASGG